ncbi:hypothetical protein JOE25_002705 [Serratia sp. PL17]|nr:hypothetical protein [Serratia sp. PL17]
MVQLSCLIAHNSLIHIILEKLSDWSEKLVHLLFAPIKSR